MVNLIMNKLTRIEICVNNNKLTHKDYQWYTKEYSNWIQEDRKIKYEIQDNGKTLKVWIDE